jgi:hypothetical protein
MANYQDTLSRLRAELAKMSQLGLTNPELMQTSFIQLVNAAETIKQKAISEKERLHSQLGACDGQVKAAEMLQEMAVNILGAYNSQEIRRLEEEKARAEEKAAESPPEAPAGDSVRYPKARASKPR